MTRWGILGTGKIARTFAEALKGNESSQLVAIGSRTAEKAQAFAEEFGIERAYSSYEELTKDDSLDIIYIATPMSCHHKDAVLCLEHGRNVLCEKSLALNADQAQEMFSLAKEKDLFFMEAMWMKLRPTFMKVKQWVQDGRIGKVQFIKADFNNYVPYDAKDRLFRADCGGGALLDMGVYPLTLVLSLLGETEDIFTRAHIGKDGVDISNTIILTYPDGCYASTSSGFEVQGRNNAVISGDKGSIVIGDFFFCSAECTLYDMEGNTIEDRVFPPEINGYEYEIREAERCLAEGLKESTIIPHEDTLAVMRLMDRCRKEWGMTFPDEQTPTE